MLHKHFDSSLGIKILITNERNLSVDQINEVDVGLNSKIKCTTKIQINSKQL